VAAGLRLSGGLSSGRLGDSFFNYLDFFMDSDKLSNYEDTRIFHTSN
jgi:hypothetical protein